MVSVLAGIVIVVVTYLMANRYWGKKVALIATLLLACNPLFILFAKMTRPEMLLTAFGMLSLFLLVVGLEKNEKILLFFAGIFMTAAAMTHINGVFVTIALLALMFIKTKVKSSLWKNGMYIIAGVGLFALPYIFFLGVHWELFIRQFFGLFTYRVPLSVQSILGNIIDEPSRWLVGRTVPIATFFPILAFFMLIKKLKHYKKICIPTLIIFFYFIFLDQSKYYGYIILLLPFLIISLAIICTKHLGKSKTNGIAILFVLLLLVSQVGAVGYKIAKDKGADYDRYCSEVQDILDKESTILADPLLYFCFPDGNLRGISVLIRIHNSAGISYEALITEQEIEYIILDPASKAFLKSGNRAFTGTGGYYDAVLSCSKIADVRDEYYTRVGMGDSITEIFKCGD